MIDLAARHAARASAVEERVLAVLRSGRWVGGPEVAEAEALLAQWMGRPAAVGLASGTDALMIALQAVGVRAGDEVIVPALTFFATAGAVAQIGARPVVVDVLEDGLIDWNAVASARGPRTTAVIPVHLFGNRVAPTETDLLVVDDAAQAIGTAPHASIGRLTAVSAYPTKTWGAAGDAGFVCGEAAAVADARRLGNHGSDGAHVHRDVGGLVGRASRLDAIQAAVLLGHAPALAARIAARRRLAARYDAGLPAGVTPLPRQPGSSVHQYCVTLDRRDKVAAALQDAGIGSAVYYRRPLDQQPALAGARHTPTPTATRLCARLLALPIGEHVDDADADRILAALRGAS